MRDVITILKEWDIPYSVWNYLSTPNDGNRFSLVDDDNRHTGPGLFRPEGQDILDPAPIQQQAVDDAVFGKHPGNIQQGNELGDRDGHNQHGSPELLEADALLVDHDGHDHAEDVVGEGRKDRPHQRPCQYRKERARKTRAPGEMVPLCYRRARTSVSGR